MNGYKIWHCSSSWYGRYGAHQSYECVVVAEIESKALGMALMEYSDTDAKDWSAQEIKTDRESVHQVSSNSN